MSDSDVKEDGKEVSTETSVKVIYTEELSLELNLVSKSYIVCSHRDAMDRCCANVSDALDEQHMCLCILYIFMIKYTKFM